MHWSIEAEALMAAPRKVGKSSNEPRTNQRIARDVALVLTADLHEKTKRAVVKNAAWAWTCDGGKYKGCRYWTQAALEQFKSAEGKAKWKGLNHEHVVPIQAIFEILKQLSTISEDSVHDCFTKCLQGIVVTVAEHKKLNGKFKKTMPEGFCYKTDDIQARYKQAGIEIVKLSEDSWK